MQAQAVGKWEFDGAQLPKHELDEKNWRAVIDNAYYQYGNYLVVELDGKGMYHFIRGSEDKSTWYPLTSQAI